MKNKRAFTLTEICVVLAIVMVLAALLFGVYARVRENGRRATCQSNLHQIFLALSQYVSDNDSHFPNGSEWKEDLSSYIKNPQMFLCPSAPRPIIRDDRSAPDKASEGTDYFYSIGWLNTLSFVPSSTGLPRPRLAGINEAVAVDVLKIPVLCDSAYTDYSREVSVPGGAACGVTDADGTPSILSRTSTIHNGGKNQLFYDGHAKWMTPEQDAEMKCEAGQYVQPPFRAGGPHIPRGS